MGQRPVRFNKIADMWCDLLVYFPQEILELYMLPNLHVTYVPLDELYMLPNLHVTYVPPFSHFSLPTFHYF